MRDLTRLDGLRNRLGATQLAVDAFEIREGTRITDHQKIAEYDRLLRENAESKLWLAAAEAEITGQYFNLPNQLKKLNKN